MAGEVRLPSQVIAAARAYGTPKWELDRRFIVRGHWRNQAVGKGGADRKRIQIQPYWKGPESGEALARAYEVATLTERDLTDS